MVASARNVPSGYELVTIIERIVIHVYWLDIGLFDSCIYVYVLLVLRLCLPVCVCCCVWCVS